MPEPVPRTYSGVQINQLKNISILSQQHKTCNTPVRRVLPQFLAAIMPFVWSCIDQQWYERQGYMKCLMDAYRRHGSDDDDERQGRHQSQHRPGGRQLVLISGPSGVGKTSLAMTLQDAVQQDGGFFCQGKFDPPSSTTISAVDTPLTSSLSPIRNDNIQMSYGPFIAAMTQYVDQVLVRGRTYSISVQSALNLLLDASERDVLEESIPALRKITRVQQQPTTLASPSSPVQHHRHNNHHDHINDTTRWLGLKGLDAEKRYIHLFTRLVQAICTPNHAMVMLIDDLQWADPNSLQLLQALTTCTTNGLMLILCTARCNIQEQLPPATTTTTSNNNHSEEAPTVFSQLFLDLKDTGVTITELQLGLLRQQDVTFLLSDLLELPAAEVQRLSAMVHQVTHGNLFFLVQLLNAWQEEEILARSPATDNIWTWDERRVQEIVACSDSPPSLLDFLTGRVLKLPEYDQRMLQTASCLATSGTIYEKLLEETVLPAASVRPALRLAAELGLLHFNPQTGTGCFAHDRIQEAIYSLIPPNERAKRHLDIGLRLWIWLPPSENETHIFTIVGQIILGLDVLEDDPIEREDLAKLMLRAARKAAQMSAFSKAAAYIQVGMSLLMERNHWKYQYDVSLALYNAAVEVEYFNGNLAQVDLLLTEIFTNAKTLDHKMQAYFTQIYSFYSRDDAQQAFAKALKVLSLLGVTFPRNPGKARVAYAWGHCKWLLQGKDDNAIMNLPIMTDRRKLVIMRLLALTTTAAALINFHFVALTVSRMISYTLRDGISDISKWHQADCPLELWVDQYAYTSLLGCFCFAILGVCLGAIVYEVPIMALSRRFSSHIKLSRCAHIGRRSQLKDEYRFGRLALQLMDKFDAREWQCRVILLHCSSGRQKLQEQIKLLQSAHRAGLVAGDIQVNAT